MLPLQRPGNDLGHCYPYKRTAGRAWSSCSCSASFRLVLRSRKPLVTQAGKDVIHCPLFH
jgi:hypothetical protein